MVIAKTKTKNSIFGSNDFLFPKLLINSLIR